MRNVNNSIETVNAAASAFISSDSRSQPSSSAQKKRWGSYWSLCWCFGSQKNNKRIGHAVHVPEPVASGVTVAPVQSSWTNSTSNFHPFIAPPSSPASFLQSASQSVSHTPHGLLSLTVNTYSRNEPPSVFDIGPYAYETQLVTPPVFSAFTTEPSTASFTPPPESAHMAATTTTPSSPEVPFAQLLTSSLERARRNNGGMNQKFSAAHYEFEHFTARKWCGSRFGSGSITPVGQGSRLGSGAMTPDGGEDFGLKLASRSITPPECSLLDSQISEVASLANSDHGSSRNVDYRVSFELTGEDVAHCLASKLNRTGLGIGLHGETESEQSQKLRSFSLGSSKEFKFDNTKEEIIEKIAVRSEWWANGNVAGKGDNSVGNSWSIFRSGLG